MTQTPARTGVPVLLVVCTALGIGTLAAAQLVTLDQFQRLSIDNDNVSTYTPIVVLVLALLAWHLSPRWSWPVLLVLGALCTVPSQLYWLDGDYLDPEHTLFLAAVAAADPLLLVGLFGGATAVWRAGRHGAGAALLGAPLAVPPLMILIVAAFIYNFGVRILPIIGLVLAGATILAAIAAAMTSRPVTSRPGWRVTIAGAVAGAAPVVVALWQWPEPPGIGEQQPDVFDAYYADVADTLLVVGPVVIGVALLAGLLAGARVLVIGTAAGLLVGAMATLLGPAARTVDDLSTEIAGLVAVAAVAASVAIASTRARTVFGVGGLGVIAVSLLVLWLVSDPVDHAFDAIIMGWVLVAVAVVSAPAFATLGPALAPDGAAPATFAGVATGVSVGVGAIVYHLRAIAAGDIEAQRTNAYLPAVVLLVAAAVLIVLANRRLTLEDT